MSGRASPLVCVSPRTDIMFGDTNLIVYVCVCMCVFCSAGNICMFRSNEAFRQSVDGGVVELDKTIENVQEFLTTVPQVREAPSLIEDHDRSVGKDTEVTVAAPQCGVFG